MVIIQRNGKYLLFFFLFEGTTKSVSVSISVRNLSGLVTIKDSDDKTVKEKLEKVVRMC